MSNMTRRGNLGLGATAAGGNAGSWASHGREASAPPPTAAIPNPEAARTAADIASARRQQIDLVIHEMELANIALLEEELVHRVTAEHPNAESVHLVRVWDDAPDWEFGGVTEDGEYVDISDQLHSQLTDIINSSGLRDGGNFDIEDTGDGVGPDGYWNEVAAIDIRQTLSRESAVRRDFAVPAPDDTAGPRTPVTVESLVEMDEAGTLHDYTSKLMADHDRVVGEHLDLLNEFPDHKMQIIDQRDFMLRVLEDNAVRGAEFRSGTDDRVTHYLNAAIPVAEARTREEFQAALTRGRLWRRRFSAVRNQVHEQHHATQGSGPRQDGEGRIERQLRQP